MLSDMLMILAIGFTVVFGWLFATWYFADDEPMFGRGSTTRVTFKNVLANAVFDIVELLRPIWLRVWLNLPFVAVIALDAVALMQPDMREAIVGNHWGGIALVVLNLVARYGSTPAHAPVAR